MNYVEKIIKLKDIVERIKKGRTGSQVQLAKELRLSKTSLNRRFTELRELGAEIEFDNIMNTYYIGNDFSITVDISKTREPQSRD